VKAVFQTVLQNALGALVQILGATGKAGVNMEIVVNLIAHKNTSF
jgi:hypothetical protein